MKTSKSIKTSKMFFYNIQARISKVSKYSRAFSITAYSPFLQTTGPHFPASQRHNKRTVKFQAIKPYAAKGALHE